jgi:hypothetical protein
MNKNIKNIDLSYSNIFINNETKSMIEKHPTLIKLDLRNTKCSSDDVKFVETILIKKSVRQNLKGRIRSDNE